MGNLDVTKKIVLTGGGTAGHVTPNIALIPHLREAGFEVSYIGSYDGMEKKLIMDYDIPYYGIATGKFRRYFDIKNLTDPFRVIKGFGEARKYLKKIRPNVVFSKGGFVSVPVVRAAASLHIPCIIHESDMTPGLANKLCISAAKKVCCNFPETYNMLPKEKAVLTGSPIREELTKGNKASAYKMCGFGDLSHRRQLRRRFHKPDSKGSFARVIKRFSGCAYLWKRQDRPRLSPQRRLYSI